MLQNILYLHGFNSHPQSVKARLTKEFAERNHFNVVIPYLQGTPKQLWQQVQGIYSELSGATLIIGSSLGGYLALTLAAHYPFAYMLLVNPLLAPKPIAYRWLNQVFVNEYSSTTFTVTPSLIDEFWPLTKFSPLWRKRCSFLLSGADEILPTAKTLAYAKGSHMIYWPTARHDFVPYRFYLATLVAYAQQVISYQAR